MNRRNMGRAFLAVGVVMQSPPGAWAQPLAAEVDPVEVNRLVQELVDQTSDPALRELIDQMGRDCVQDLQVDGELDNERLVEAVKDVQAVSEAKADAVREALETGLTEAGSIAGSDPRLLEQMQDAMAALDTGANPEQIMRDLLAGMFDAPGHQMTAGVGDLEHDELRPIMEAMHEAMAGNMHEFFSALDSSAKEYASAEFKEFVHESTQGFELGRSQEELAGQQELLREVAGGTIDPVRAADIFDLDPQERAMLSQMSPDEARGFLEGVQREDMGFGEMGDFHEYGEGPDEHMLSEFSHETETLDDFYHDLAGDIRELLEAHDLAAEDRQGLLNDIRIGLSDVQAQERDSRYAATLNAVEQNLTQTERSEVLTGAPLHKEFTADVDPAVSGSEHLHVDYSRGIEGIPHADATAQIHDHKATDNSSDDQFIGTIAHITDVCAAGLPDC